jgi:hypothetical protein
MSDVTDRIKALPFNKDKVARLRGVALAVIGETIRDEYEGDIAYADAVYAALDILAFLCGTAETVPDVRLGVQEAATVVRGGGLERTALMYHGELMGQLDRTIPEDQYDA